MRISDWSSDVCSSDLKTEDPQAFIDAVELLEPSFGGINLEDIAAPNCFIIEAALKERMNIPAFHDDQHGTAIITAAGLLNACHLTGRKLADIRVVVNGAGAAAIRSDAHTSELQSLMRISYAVLGLTNKI